MNGSHDRSHETNGMILAPTMPEIGAEAGTVTCVVAADIGNARAILLAQSADDSRPREIAMPAIRTLRGAHSSHLFSARGLPAGSWNRLGPDEHVIANTLTGIETYVGALATDTEAPASGGRGSNRRYTDGTVRDILLAGIAAAYPRSRKIVVSTLAIILPIKLYDQLRDATEKALRGTIEFLYRGQATTITIQAVLVRREAEAAYSALPGAKDGRTLIVDAGGRTVNLAMFADGIYRMGDTLEMGVEGALDDMDVDLMGRIGRTLTLRERFTLQAALVAGTTFTVNGPNGKPISLIPSARAWLDTVAAEAVREMYAKVRVDRAEHIHLIGGGAHTGLFGQVFRDSLLVVEPTSSRPEAANVLGLLADLTGVVVKPNRKR